MPTDLPPDYKPQPAPHPGAAPGAPILPDADSLDPSGGVRHGPRVGSVPGADGDVVDPSGLSEPPMAPGLDPFGIPTPAGTPSF